MPITVKEVSVSVLDYRVVGWIIVLIWCSYSWGPVCGQTALPCPAFGEKPLRAKNEFGVNFAALVHFNYNSLYPRPKDPRASFLNGIVYKRRISRGAYRICADVYRDTFEARGDLGNRPGYFSARGSGMRAEIRLGYEHQFTTGKFKPYAAVDIIGGYERLRLIGEGRGGDLISQIQPYSYDISTMHYGASLSIGLAYRISKRFSCSMEGGAGS